jgi:alkylation response protein AidB-like acyl-CoA dehydrogenase
VDFDIPKDLADYLVELDEFIEREIKPLEQQNDNIRFFDHRREDARTDWDRGGLPNEEWERLLFDAKRVADKAGHYRYPFPVEYGGKDMATAHSNLKIQKRHFHAVADHLISTLYAMGVNEEMIGEVVSTVAMVWLHVLVLPHGSLASHVRVATNVLPQPWFVTVLTIETVTEPHASLAAGSSKVRLPTPHSLVLFPEHVMLGGLASLTVMVCGQMALLPNWSVAR